AYFLMLLNGVTPIPPDRNIAGFELSFSGNTKLPSGAVILTRVPRSRLASFFLNGVSLILVLIKMDSSSVGEEATVKDLIGPSGSSFVPRSTTAYCPAL